MLGSHVKSNDMWRAGKAASGLRAHLPAVWRTEVTAVDEHAKRTVIQLCTKIGMIMEDASAPAILCAGLDDAELKSVVDDLVASIDEMRTLAAAAAVLVTR